MIDIHCHILPMLDDGARSVEQALDMLAMAYENGTDALILTPHMALPYGFDNPYEKTKRYFQDFCEIVQRAGIPVQLYLGMELLYSSKSDFEQLQEELRTLNGSRYLLTEFFFDVAGSTILEAVQTIRQAGMVPVLAHPERYECIQTDPTVILQAQKSGACVQVNKGSFFGDYGRMAKNTVWELMERDAVDFIASDAHNRQTRTPVMADAFDWVAQYFGMRRARALLLDHPAMVIEDKEGIR